MADKGESTARETHSRDGYVFRGGLIRKGGLNPDVPRGTVRPDPPAPLGPTGGVSPAAAPEEPAQETPQAREGVSGIERRIFKLIPGGSRSALGPGVHKGASL